jgi:hypothetical protein
MAKSLMDPQGIHGGVVYQNKQKKQSSNGFLNQKLCRLAWVSAPNTMKIHTFFCRVEMDILLLAVYAVTLVRG